ncbi:helix-turn-helix transcriptional regulator [Sphingobacterium yanglingense]|uniref:Helix-turn-helix protein n=1 Tax=Sphingobacterium yanglingense TaxID=1437280 RepID=A0A4R6W7S7_9SPHI|nr:helix-turn-helix domain-containing protein [Sphingobacterium yanglingense]TDQ73666.1 helix-turn-helix protein [Sphingobacterium yanglingense]
MEHLPKDLAIHLVEIHSYAREMRDYMLQIRDCLLVQHVVPQPSLRDQKLLDIEQVLRILRIGRSTYYRFVNAGKLVPRKIGERHCYYLEDLEEMIQESKRRGRI